MTVPTQLIALEAFLQAHSTIKYISPSSPDYVGARQVWNCARRDKPLAVVLPQSHADVAALIKYAKANFLPFTLRSGGHNLEGLAIAEDALLIDLRALTGVHVASNRKSATVQGGTFQGEVGNVLWKEGLATPLGTIPSVGYIGWATYGGYGPFSAHWGLGIDQILGATLVNPDGEIVKADESILQGIRGAGGLFGVILELTIKVYPLTSLLAGPIVFDSTDIKKTFVDFNAAYHELEMDCVPAEMTLQQAAFNGPHGRMFMVLFAWSGDDLKEGQRWSDKIAALGPMISNAVAPTTIPEWFVTTGAMVPSTAFGSVYTHNFSEVTPEIAEVIGRGIAIMPNDPGTMLSLHQLRGPSTTPQAPSVFEARTPHFMLESLGFSTNPDIQPESERWAAELAQRAGQASPEALLPTAYISLCPIAQAKSRAEHLKRTYGSKADMLTNLKAEFDPENVFSLTVPLLK